MPYVIFSTYSTFLGAQFSAIRVDRPRLDLGPVFWLTVFSLSNRSHKYVFDLCYYGAIFKNVFYLRCLRIMCLKIKSLDFPYLTAEFVTTFSLYLLYTLQHFNLEEVGFFQRSWKIFTFFQPINGIFHQCLTHTFVVFSKPWLIVIQTFAKQSIEANAEWFHEHYLKL